MGFEYTNQSLSLISAGEPVELGMNVLCVAMFVFVVTLKQQAEGNFAGKVKKYCDSDFCVQTNTDTSVCAKDDITNIMDMKIHINHTL